MRILCANLWPLAVFGAYPEYPAREIVSLNPWIRTFSNGSTAEVTLPEVFVERTVVNYTLDLPERERSALLKFTCSLRCELFVDGEIWASNDNPYLPVFAPLPARAQRLCLSVDSKFLGRHSLHQIQYDWWQPGGIFNDVELHLLRDVAAFLHTVLVYPLEFPNIRIEVNASADLGLALSFDNQQPSLVNDMQVGIPFQMAVPEAKPWSLSSPNLHHLTVYLVDGDQVKDIIVTRFGLRHVEARDSRIFLNGEPVQLLGVNRHHFGPNGAILSLHDIAVDVSHVKHLGGNFIRGAHYPQDPRLLDMCDEDGILVWEETLAWQNSVAELNNATWMAMQKSQIRRILQASANHPSVIIVGFLNEGASTNPLSIGAYEELAAEVRLRDPTRLVSWASPTATRDVVWQHADVISINDYSAWYPTTVNASKDDVKAIPHVWQYYKEWATNAFPGKPVIASEFGAGGLSGNHGSALEKWTEECQSLLLQLHLLGALQAELAGVCIWQLTDCPVDPTTSPIYRRNGLNNKGLLSVKRKPKMAYGAVYAIYHGKRRLLLTDADMELFKDEFPQREES